MWILRKYLALEPCKEAMEYWERIKQTKNNESFYYYWVNRNTPYSIKARIAISIGLLCFSNQILFYFRSIFKYYLRKKALD